MLLKFFTNLPEYKIIVFSTSKEAIKLEDNELDESIDIVRRNMSKQTREVIDEYDLRGKAAADGHVYAEV